MKQQYHTPTRPRSFALDLSREGLTLYQRGADHQWQAVASAPLKLGTVASSMRKLRAATGVTDDQVLSIEVWLPADQVSVHVFDRDGLPPTEKELADHFAQSDSADTLRFDQAERPYSAMFDVATVPTSTLVETREFLAPHGFRIKNYTLGAVPEGLKHIPVFMLDPPHTPVPWSFVAAVGGGLAAALVGAIWWGTQVFTPTPDPLQSLAALQVGQAQAIRGAQSAFDLRPGPGTPIDRPQPLSALRVTPASTPPEPFTPPVQSQTQPQVLVSMAPTQQPVLSNVPQLPGQLPTRLATPPPSGLTLRDLPPDLPDRFTAPVQTEVVAATPANPGALASLPGAATAVADTPPPSPLRITATSTAPERFVPATVPDDRAIAQVRFVGLGEARVGELPKRPGRGRILPPPLPPEAIALRDLKPVLPNVFTGLIQTEVARGGPPTAIPTDQGSPVSPLVAAPTVTPGALAPVGPTSPASEGVDIARATQATPRPTHPGQAPSLAIQDEPQAISLTRAPLPGSEITDIGTAGPGQLLSPTPDRAARKLRIDGVPVGLTGVIVPVSPELPDVVPPRRPPEIEAPATQSGVAPADIAPADEASTTVVPNTDQVRVIAGRPDILPTARPSADPATETSTGFAAEVAALIAEAAPEDLSPSELAISQSDRPAQRPAAIVEAEEARVAALAPSELAIGASDGPRQRPAGLAAPSAAAALTPAPATAVVRAPAVAPSAPATTAAPPLPTSASVARAATIEDAMPLRSIVLVGVYGKSNNRHALLRTPNGRFVKVTPGDAIDGYEVAAISPDAIRLRRRGRDTLLVIPE